MSEPKGPSVIKSAFHPTDGDIEVDGAEWSAKVCCFKEILYIVEVVKLSNCL